jgi:hypothetical protein
VKREAQGHFLLQLHRRISENKEFSGRVRAAKNVAAITLRQPQILLEFYRSYYKHTAIFDRLFEEVSASAAMAYDMARSGGHNTKENFILS